MANAMISRCRFRDYEIAERIGFCKKVSEAGFRVKVVERPDIWSVDVFYTNNPQHDLREVDQEYRTTGDDPQLERETFALKRSFRSIVARTNHYVKR